MTKLLRDALQRHLLPESIDAMVTEVCGAVEQAAQEGNLLVVGSAQLPEKVVRAVQAAGGKVGGVVEFAPQFWGRRVSGVQVTSLNEALEKLGPDPLALVGIWSPNHIYAKTRDWLATFGVQRTLPVNAAFWSYADILGAWYQFGDPHLYHLRADHILKVFDSLSDDESKQQFAGIIQYRVTLDPTHIPNPTPSRIYFDPAVSRLSSDVVVADIGAFNGDTLDKFLVWHGSSFGRFVAFEPDPISFGRLVAYQSKLPKHVRAKVDCIHSAVAEKSGTLYFSPQGNPGNRATETGDVAVACTTIDEFFRSLDVGYIKVDVEGAEPHVIAGAWEAIERSRPVIGLSIYHDPDHVFSLPLQLIERLEDYEYYIRAHDHDGIDLIFYAVPNEKSTRKQHDNNS